MSGPKVSSYELDQMRREALRRQQEAELQRRLEEERRRRIEINRQSIVNCKSQACKIESDVVSKWSVLVERAKVMQQKIEESRILVLSEAVDKFQKNCANPLALAQDSANVTVCTQMLAEIHSISEKLLRYIAEENERFDELNRQEARIEFQKIIERKEKKEVEKREEERRERERAEDLSKKIEENLERLVEEFPESIIQRIDAIRMQLANIRDNYKKSASQQTNMLRSLYERELKKVLHEVDEWRALEPLRVQCASLCNLLRQPVPQHLLQMSKQELLMLEKDLQTSVMLDTLRRECIELYNMLGRSTSASIWTMGKDELEELLVQLKEAKLEQQSRAYIAKAVEETMQEMGYDLAASKDGDVTQEYLYSVHGNTMLRVNCQPNGNISMSIGMGTKERGHELSITEKDGLVSDMTTFCTKYEEIQRRLWEKGVRLNRNIVLRPADARYARAIDITEFGLDHMPSGVATRSGRKGQANGKKMYSGEE